jgi:hypothetical protein
MTTMEEMEVVEMITSTGVRKEGKKPQSRSSKEFGRLEYLSRCICYMSLTREQFIYKKPDIWEQT